MMNNYSGCYSSIAALMRETGVYSRSGITHLCQALDLFVDLTDPESFSACITEDRDYLEIRFSFIVFELYEDSRDLFLLLMEISSDMFFAFNEKSATVELVFLFRI